MIRCAASADVPGGYLERELADAADALDVEGMRRALEAGAIPWVEELYWSRSWAAERVLHAKRPRAAAMDSTRAAALSLLGEHGGFVTGSCTTLLGEAATHLNLGPAVVQVLLDAGANPRYTGAKNVTLLHMCPRADTAKVLIAAGADVHARERNQTTPLHACAEFDQPALAKVLVRAGARVDARDNCGRTPLHMAAYSGIWAGSKPSPAVVRVLLANGANPTKGCRGWPCDGQAHWQWWSISSQMATTRRMLRTSATSMGRAWLPFASWRAPRPGGVAGTCCWRSADGRRSGRMTCGLEWRIAANSAEAHNKLHRQWQQTGAPPHTRRRRQSSSPSTSSPSSLSVASP